MPPSENFTGMLIRDLGATVARVMAHNHKCSGCKRDYRCQYPGACDQMDLHFCDECVEAMRV